MFACTVKLLTEIPRPKFAVVSAWEKCVFVPVTMTFSVALWPACDGESCEIAAGPFVTANALASVST
jgi:hypothetical protein